MLPTRPAVAAVVAALLTSCTAAPVPTDGVSGDVVVLAAASLTGAFDELVEAFEAEYDGVRVVTSYGGSSGLAQQVLSGAPGDVLAAASPGPMQAVVDAGQTAGEPVVVARNRLEIAVPADDPGRVTGLQDLADRERTIALCAPEVPCGTASMQAFAAAGLTGAPDTLEQDVKAVLSKVRLGEVDAGLVYRTDVLAAGDDVRGIPFPQADAAVNDYPVAVLAGAANPAAARAFVEFLRGPEGRRALRDAGFDVD